MAYIFGKLGPGSSEIIVGTPGDDEIYPLGGNDFIDGGRGFDIVYVSAKSTSFRISTINGITYLDATSGASTGVGSTLRNVERVQFDDKAISLMVNDRVANSPARDLVDGGPGTDTFIYEGLRSDFRVKADYDSATVSVQRVDGLEAVDFLTNFERLEFAGGHRVALDLGVTESAGEAALLIGAVLGKAALPLKGDLIGAVIALIDEGATLVQLSGVVMGLPIWGGTLTPTDSAQDIARYLLRTVMGAEPDATAVATGARALAAESGPTQGSWLAQLAVSATNQAQVNLVGLQVTGLDYSASG